MSFETKIGKEKLNVGHLHFSSNKKRGRKKLRDGEP